jgi:hypothetical protein
MLVTVDVRAPGTPKPDTRATVVGIERGRSGKISRAVAPVKGIPSARAVAHKSRVILLGRRKTLLTGKGSVRVRASPKVRRREELLLTFKLFDRVKKVNCFACE